MKILLKEHIMTISMLAGTAAAILLSSFSAFAAECDGMPDKLFRLHILANSDTQEDQQLKYELKDYLLQDLDDVFQGCTTAEEAKTAAEENLSLIARRSQEFVEEKGCDQTVKVSVENTYFTTRRYGSLTVPAGNYDALRIVIGEGEGHNWWCVMFPPLCLGAAEKYENTAGDLLPDAVSARVSKQIEGDGPFELRFAIFEWLKARF
ncbi:MAG: stage II sporulation protein R, partial [[Eubacterium] siraeum]|nr:stage II sporulation protein R [[Eubacterium] siraeum]